MQPLADMFQDYARRMPPTTIRCADFAEPVAASHLVWSIAYNTELVKDPPKSWMDLTKPEYDRMTGQVFAQSGGTTWTRIMFERLVLGEEYWAKAGDHPSGALSVRRADGGFIGAWRNRDGPLALQCDLSETERRRADQDFLPARGRAGQSLRHRNSEDRGAPQCAKLFLNWCLSKEGQTFMIKELGHLTSLKEAPVYPEGFDPKVVKIWLPNFDDYVKLHTAWVADWDKIFGYRQ